MRIEPPAIRGFFFGSLALVAAGCGVASAGPLAGLLAGLVVALGVLASGCPAASKETADAGGSMAAPDGVAGIGGPDAQTTQGDTTVDVSEDSEGGGAADDDWDGDGVLNQADNCPWVENILQGDADADDVGDACDTCDYPNYLTPCGDPCCYDADGDGINGGGDVPPGGPDNCPFVSNPDQEDADGDGVGDVCDPDYGVALVPARHEDDARWAIIARLRACGTLNDHVVSLLEPRT